ncbi:MAG TPA: 2-dehydro-3-deoxyphosphogluconate aldolase, partial [Cupriavidus sp.]|nr:2-dehydro-3-deoxyphosphogluconate aldolase [Cupriavidus sp.]
MPIQASPLLERLTNVPVIPVLEYHSVDDA